MMLAYFEPEWDQACWESWPAGGGECQDQEGVTRAGCVRFLGCDRGP